MLGRVTGLLVAVALLAGCAADAADADEREAASDAAEIVGTTLADGEHPEVVRLLLKSPAGDATCTGTLIGAHTVLTARHCVESRTDLATGACTITALVDRSGRAALDGADAYPAARCDWVPSSGLFASQSDVATIRLARDVAGVAPATLADEATPTGAYTAYGYGSFGAAPTFGETCEHRSDGHKRKASYRGGLGFKLGQVTCPGDSGGPHFVQNTSIVAGVTSTGFALLVAYETNASVARHHAWLAGMLRAYGDAR